MNHQRTLWPLAGLGFAVAVVVEAIAFPGGASSDQPATTIAAYYVHHGGTDLVADYVSLLATPMLLAFLCAAAGRLAGPAARFAQAVATAAAVFELTATAIEVALAGRISTSAPASTTAALFQVTPRLFFVSLLCLGLCIGTIATRDRGWLRWLGAGSAVVLVATGLAAAQPHGALGVLVLPAEALLASWVVAGAVTSIRRPAPASRPAAAAVAG